MLSRLPLDGYTWVAYMRYFSVKNRKKKSIFCVRYELNILTAKRTPPHLEWQLASNTWFSVRVFGLWISILSWIFTIFPIKVFQFCGVQCLPCTMSEPSAAASPAEQYKRPSRRSRFNCWYNIIFPLPDSRNGSAGKNLIRNENTIGSTSVKWGEKNDFRSEITKKIQI